MDIFYTSVLSVAVIVLILILTYVGIMLSYSNSQSTTFPPVSNVCPDYWLNSTDGSGCVVPSSGSKNAGLLFDGNGSPTAGLLATTGYNSSKKTIDFSNPKWGEGGSLLCSQKKWADKNEIVWDGVSNYNSCATSSSS